MRRVYVAGLLGLSALGGCQASRPEPMIRDAEPPVDSKAAAEGMGFDRGPDASPEVAPDLPIPAPDGGRPDLRRPIDGPEADAERDARDAEADARDADADAPDAEADAPGAPDAPDADACETRPCPVLVERCDDGVDNDLDGLLDCLDETCDADLHCHPPPENCENGVDDDFDRLTDCQDPSCFLQPRCLPMPEICDDGIDNDLDLRIDCCQPVCAHAPHCPPLPVVPFTVDDLQGFIGARCTDCHLGEQRQSDLSLNPPFGDRTIGISSAQLPSMKLIEPGDRTRSYLYHKVAGTQVRAGGGGTPMPPEVGLCADDIERIGLYIDSL